MDLSLLVLLPSGLSCHETMFSASLLFITRLEYVTWITLRNMELYLIATPEGISLHVVRAFILY